MDIRIWNVCLQFLLSCMNYSTTLSNSNLNFKNSMILALYSKNKDATFYKLMFKPNLCTEEGNCGLWFTKIYNNNLIRVSILCK